MDNTKPFIVLMVRHQTNGTIVFPMKRGDGERMVQFETLHQAEDACRKNPLAKASSCLIIDIETETIYGL